MNIRTEMENDVKSCNRILADKVKEMSLLELLRNTHPIYREKFARRLYSENLLTLVEVKEFVKIL